jgi:thiol-disulfide isomerase/thioredoxin
MRTLLLFINCVMVILNVEGQTNIQIVLKHNDKYIIDKVDIFDLSQKQIFESAYRDTLNFSFDKDNVDCYNIRYFENGTMFRNQIWLDNGDIKIEAHLDATKLVIDTVYNSPKYYEHLKFTQNYARLYKSKDSTALNEMILGYYAKNIDNPLSLMAASSYIILNQNSRPNLSKLKLLADQQGDKFKWFLLYPSVAAQLTNLLASDKLDLDSYSFIDRQNGKVKLPERTKKYYVLDFWFLACPPCVKDHKEIAMSLGFLEKKGAELISISTDEDVKKWTAYLSKNNYNWQNYLETEASKITETIGIGVYPTYLILDNTGKILNTQNAFSEVLTWLEKSK